MSSAYIKRLLALACAGAALLATSAPASAGIFNVKPIRLFLSKDAGSVILTVQNQDSAPLRIQIAGMKWRNDRAGDTVLTPTDDLIVFPTLFTMAPLETRNIRIGFSGAPPSASELTYRITIDELPSLESQIAQAHAAGLSVRTRITVPVFFQPDTASKKAEVQAISLHRGIAQTLFANEGNFHVVVSDVDMTGRDSAGRRVFSNTQKGWYVLAGETRAFQAAVPRKLCASIKTLSVTVHADTGSYSRTGALQPGDCR